MYVCLLVFYVRVFSHLIVFVFSCCDCGINIDQLHDMSFQSNLQQYVLGMTEASIMHTYIHTYDRKHPYLHTQKNTYGNAAVVTNPSQKGTIRRRNDAQQER